MKNQTIPILRNIFSAIPEQLPEEFLTCLLRREDVLIERIVSKGHVTAEGQWYDQSWDEWVILLQGQASLRYENSEQLIQLDVGDYILIPAHTRHRVEWTPQDIKSIWLAVHLQGSK